MQTNEKNKNKKKTTKSHYSSWEKHYGREDAEMLFEKSKQEMSGLKNEGNRY